jgi:lantibiotic biosynthesis protein
MAQRSYPLPPLSPPGPTERDEVLCAVLAEALRSGSRQVELDDELVDRLSTPQPAPGGPPARAVEMVVQIAAASREALDRGEWQAAAIPGCVVPGGRMFGRFLDLLGDGALEALRAYARREERLFPELISAELSYFPAGRRGNVVLCPRLRDHEIVVNATPSLPPERVIDLDDLVVGADDQRFCLRSLSRGRRVVVTQSHMLNLMLAPNVYRFLREVSADGRPLPSAFDWGVVRNAPRLPRLLRDKVVLSPAQWNLRPSPATGVPPAGGDERFFLALRRWRATWQVPRHVHLHLEDGGDRLLLDLEHPLSVAQLRKELDKAGGSGLVRLQELLPGFRHLWLRDDDDDRAFFSEIVVPLLPRRATGRSGALAGERHPTQRPVDPRSPVPDDVRYVLPGGDWTYLKLYTPARQHDELIAGPARDIVRVLRERGLVDHWFFVRYRDPAPHLRVRFHARAPDAQGAVLVEAAAWARELTGQGLINRVVLEPYVREVERYGGPDAVAVLEQVFSADSTLDRLATSFGLDSPGRLRFIQGLAGGDREPVAALQGRRLLLGDLLVDRDARRASLAEERAAQGDLLSELWTVQEPTLRPLFARVRELAEHGKLWQPEQDILASLVHMHVNRLLGIDAEREGIVYALWRHTLESIRRRGQVTGDRA